MPTYWLFLDDERSPNFVGWENFVNPKYDRIAICRTYEEFKNCIVSFGIPERISFDHDLGDGPSGYDCAKWLANWFIDNPNRYKDIDINIHSMNPVGRDNIRGLLRNLKRFFDSYEKYQDNSSDRNRLN